MGKTTADALNPLRRMSGTGHLPPAEKKRLREERQARREYAARLASNEALAVAKQRKAAGIDGANRQDDPVDPGFACPSNADDLALMGDSAPAKPARAKKPKP